MDNSIATFFERKASGNARMIHVHSMGALKGAKEMESHGSGVPYRA